MKHRIFNWRQGQNERFLETRKTIAMWDSTPAKIHGELNAFYPFYNLVLLLIKSIRKKQYCLLHEHHFVKIIWKYNCSTTTSTTSSALLARAVFKTFLSTQSEFFVIDIFRCSEALIFWCSDVQMFRCFNILRCWECDHVVHVQMFISSYMFRGWIFKCSDVPRFSCSKASRKCSKYQLSLQMSSIWELYLMTQNAHRNILQVF